MDSGDLIRLSILAGTAVAAYLLMRYALLPLIYQAVHRSTTQWDNILGDHKVQNRVAWLIPLIVVRGGLAASIIDSEAEDLVGLGERLLDSLLIVMTLMVINAIFNAVNNIYTQTEISKHRPIKGLLQVVMIVLSFVGIILIIARLANQPIAYFLGGLGALSAVLILVFQSTLLSIVASLQLAQNNMVAVGDWIEMPRYGVDGEVIEIALHTVSIQNWNKTIVTVPTSKLISESFVNWKGMYETGGRRFKRAIHIDLNSVRFLTIEEIERWSRFTPLVEYMKEKVEELAVWNSQLFHYPGQTTDPRRLTNLGTFRAYIYAYLRTHPEVDSENLTLLVRQLPPGPHGIPMELYGFTRTTDWGRYESIQSDIFDHLLAMLDEFGLEVYQSLSGGDMRSISIPDVEPDHPPPRIVPI